MARCELQPAGPSSVEQGMVKDGTDQGRVPHQWVCWGLRYCAKVCGLLPVSLGQHGRVRSKDFQHSGPEGRAESLGRDCRAVSQSAICHPDAASYPRPFLSSWAHYRSSATSWALFCEVEIFVLPIGVTVMTQKWHRLFSERQHERVVLKTKSVFGERVTFHRGCVRWCVLGGT